VLKAVGYFTNSRAVNNYYSLSDSH